MKKLRSFHGKPEIKEACLERLRGFYRTGEITQFRFGEEGKGCLECTTNSKDPAAYETELGIPRVLACLKDRIFEGLPEEKASMFPILFLEAIPVGADLDPVWRKLMIWLLEDETEGVINHVRMEHFQRSVTDISNAFRDSLAGRVPSERWIELRGAAVAAFDAVYAAIYAVDAAAEDAAAYAHRAGDAAAHAVEAAADAAADAASAYAGADGAAEAARHEKFTIIADKLIGLLKEAQAGRFRQ